MNERRLFELILSIKRKCQAREDIIQNEIGLSQAEFNGLLVLEPDECIQGFHFAERMGLSPSRGSRVLSKLTQRGLTRSEFKPEDRRSVTISLTPEGIDTKEDIIERMQSCEEHICSQLEACHLDQIRDSLERLDKVL
ncbi:winged helix DNA-binding protein [bacterium]|nr:winged helix DNA-binding protein [bacterium]